MPQSTFPASTTVRLAATANPTSVRPKVWMDYLQLAKPEIAFLVTISSVAGFLVGSPGGIEIGVLLPTLIGTLFSAAGAGALNHFAERSLDGRMRRTQNRPIPTGRITPAAARTFGIACSAIGAAILCPLVNPMTAVLAVLATGIYILVYTPLKTKTTANTLVGTIPGALPALGGYVAATGSFGASGWVVFFVLVFWQLPHFFALAWMYRKDYGRGQYRMVSVHDDTGKRTAAAALAGTVATLIAASGLFWFGNQGIFYLTATAAIGLWLLADSVVFATRRDAIAAKGLLKSSIRYIPLFVLILMIDRAIG